MSKQQVSAVNDMNQLLQPVSMLPGVGARRVTMLARLGLATWFDLLTFFPRDYENWLSLTPLSELEHQQTAVFRATVAQKPVLSRKGRLNILQTVLQDDAYSIKAVWFNQPWHAQRLVPGQTFVFRGRVKRKGRLFSVENPSFEPDEHLPEKQRLRPVYPLTQGLRQSFIRQLTENLIPRVISIVPEPLPARIRREYHLCAAAFAYSRIHHPADWEEADICRQRLAFEELFLFQAGIYLLRQSARDSRKAYRAVISESRRHILQACINQLPFTLTHAQQQAWQTIHHDLGSERPMNRLLQGDVGSGKTVVAALAMLHCALAGMQAVLMAPTAVLARQHHQTLARLLAGSGFEVELLTGATKKTDRNKLLQSLEEGGLQLLVGTHALIEDRVRFKCLALAITDEQHRFGVRQRIRLTENTSGETENKAQSESTQLVPHVLVMSATPIPRTLALMLYGDLDISVIDQLPEGRKPISTYTARQKDRPRIDALIRKTIDAGHQVYVVCPMIEESAESDLESAENVWQRISAQMPDSHEAGLLHGRMKPSEKDKVMDRFLSGKCAVLVSTTVIEVGVDNPNAVLMIIENAERFGLAQLHQLRGRIGRGEQASLCVLISEADDELARSRLTAVCRSRDGFELAEKDLQLRGPGDFFGTRQHGLPPLRVANLYQDQDLIQKSRKALNSLLREDPDLMHAENRIIRQTLNLRYGDVFAHIGI